MKRVTDPEIVAAMSVYGGGFVAALANALTRADPENFARLKSAFPEYWKEYADLVRTNGKGKP